MRLHLQAKCSHLEGSQLNFHLAILHFQFLLVILQNIALPYSLDRQDRSDGTSALSTERLIYTQDNTSATSLAQLAARYVFVVFTTLDSIEYK